MYIHRFTRQFSIVLFLLLPLTAIQVVAHGGHMPLLSGDPNTLEDGAIVERDAAGRLVKVSIDTDGDGKPDIWNHFENGIFARQNQDTDGDGTPDVLIEVDKLGKPLQAQRDTNADNQVDVVDYFYEGKVVRQEIDSNHDGVFDSFMRFADEHPVSMQEDTDGDGQVDRWLYFDGEGQVSQLLRDADRDGFPDKITSQDNISKTKPAPITPQDQIVPQEGTDTVLEEEVVHRRRPLTSASDSEVRAKDFLSFPRQNPSDLVRIIPGVHVSQHTGGAKAYQYFLRGFDAEHGQDLAGYLDGIPLNEPSQIHGHGYLDLHFLIPETISGIKIMKGPYDPEYGNFATAGAINFIPRRSGDQQTVSVTAGMYGTAKALGTFAFSKDFYSLTGALQTDHTEGYTDPGWSDAVRGNMSHTWIFGQWSLHLMSHHYAQKSAATDVIPEAWVEEGIIGRYDSLDDTDLVTSNRHIVGLTLDQDSGAGALRLQTWFDYKRTTIWSNYTYYLFQPELGDQQEMRDNRQVTGANVRYEHGFCWGPTVWNVTAGVQWRLDMVDKLLAGTQERKRYNVINDLQFTENALGAWAKLEFIPAHWVTLVPGVRYDMIFYNGEGTQDERYFNIYTNRADTHQDVKRDWSENAGILSPKVSVIFSPLKIWDIFLNYGEGFFSFATDQMAEDPDNEIPKVTGGEVGTRLYFWNNRITFGSAAWFVDKEQDYIFDPLTGLASSKEATRRLGLDGELRINPLSWLYVSTDASWVDARYQDSGDRISNGPIFMMTNGIGWNHSIGLRGMVRGRYMARRELDNDEWAPAFYIVDLVAGYDRKHWGVEAAIDNVFDTEWEDAVFSYQSRPEKNGEIHEGIHWTPGTPFFARLTVTAKW